MYDSVMLKYNF